MGGRIIRLQSVASTNDVGKRLLRDGEPHGTVVVAAEQTQGRGQRGRRWVSPPGGLWASLLLRPHGMSVAQAGLLNLAAAVAAAEAVSSVCRAATRVKWPNDLLVSGRKVGGVLVETSATAGTTKWAVIGIGVNANFHLDVLPRRLRTTTTSLRHETGHTVPLDALLAEIRTRVGILVELLETGEDEQILALWRALDSTPGREVRPARGGGWHGRAAGIDSWGRLVVGIGKRVTHLPTSRGVVIE